DLEHREGFIAGATRQHGPRLGKNVERELAEDQPHLPSVDVLPLQLCSTLLWKLAQWGQVIEAYSTMVTLASGLPSTRSGNGPGFISSSTGTSDGPRRCASSSELREPMARAPMASPAETINVRRLTLTELMIADRDKGLLLEFITKRLSAVRWQFIGNSLMQF